MKSVIIIAVTLFTLCLAAQAQRPYSYEYLQKASAEEVDLLYNKALKHQKAGRILNISGVSLLGGSALGIAAFASSMGMAAILFVFPITAGVVALAVGIPINLTAKGRLETIDALRRTALRNVSLELLSAPQYNYVSQNYEPAITLRICF